MAKTRMGGPLAFVWKPIDFAALAERRREESRWCRKGVKRRKSDVVAALARQNKIKKRRRLKANLRRRALQEAARNRKRERHRSIINPVLVLLEPGGWFAATDLARVLGVKTRTVSCAFWHLAKYGFLESAKNPDWSPEAGARVLAFAERPYAPRLLYRLTEAGTRRREKALAIVGAPAVGSGHGQSGPGQTEG